MNLLKSLLTGVDNEADKYLYLERLEYFPGDTVRIIVVDKMVDCGKCIVAI